MYQAEKKEATKKRKKKNYEKGKKKRKKPGKETRKPETEKRYQCRCLFPPPNAQATPTLPTRFTHRKDITILDTWRFRPHDSREHRVGWSSFVVRFSIASG